MTSANVQQKARDYLWAGKVRVTYMHDDIALVEVQGTGDKPYSVKLQGGVWSCDCPAQVEQCTHVVAAGKIVKWDPFQAPSFGEVANTGELMDLDPETFLGNLGG